MKKHLAKFGYWLWTKNRIVTATEIELLHRTKTIKCEHCGKSPYHLLDKSCCKEAL